MKTNSEKRKNISEQFWNITDEVLSFSLFIAFSFFVYELLKVTQ